MKKTFFKLTLIAALGLGLGSCTKKTTSTPASTTPSFTASMNGTSTTFTGKASLGSNYLTITGVGTNYTITIYDKLPVQVGSAVTLGAPGGTYASVTTGAGQFWETSSTSTGTLTITTYDTSTNLVTGTFSFTGTPSSGTGNMAVTGGSFANITF